MRTVAILPVKSFPAAKQRLREGLEADRTDGLGAARADGLETARAEGLGAAGVDALVQEMFSAVLGALRHSRVDEILVVTAWPAAGRIAAGLDIPVVEDREVGHNQAAALGISRAVAAGAERVLLVPGDCPALDPGEIDDLLARRVDPPSALVVPDRHGTGTNALLLTPPDALEPSFGPGSCRRHMELARARGTHCEVVSVPSLALDIDTPADLEHLAARRC